MSYANGGTNPVDYEAADRLSKEISERNRNRGIGSEEKPTAWFDRAVYASAYNVLTNAPVDGSNEGVETMRGRVWVEARSIVHSGGVGASSITVESTQNGVRACIETPAGTTLTSGSFRYWLQDVVTKKWGLGGVDEALAAGVQRVWGTDQFVTVGAR